MQNPQAFSTNTNMIAPKTMFDYMTHRNIPWNDTEYQPVRQYLDPNKQANDRKYAEQKKGEKDNKYLTRKGFYMDYHLKVVKALPAPSAYNLADEWDQEQNKKQSKNKKIDSKISKYSYLDLIETDQKNRKRPAPGTYNLNKTEDQIKADTERMRTRKMSHGPKRYFYEQSEYLSSLHPGAGANNPHYSVDHIKMNKTTPKFWVQKHKKQSDKRRKSSTPGPCNYSPCHVEFDSFIKTATNTEKMKKTKDTKTGFGTDTKFTYDRPVKRKIIETRPAPSTYRMEVQWNGKNTDDKNKNNWMRTRSTGFSKSVYN